MTSTPAPSPDALEVVDLAGSEMTEAVDLPARGMRDNPVHIAAYGGDPDRRERLIHAAFRSVFENFVHVTAALALRPVSRLPGSG